MSKPTYPFNKLEYTDFMSAESSGPWANAWSDNRQEYDRVRQVRAERRSARAREVRANTSFTGFSADSSNV
jgi:hypothetical protein